MGQAFGGDAAFGNAFAELVCYVCSGHGGGIQTVCVTGGGNGKDHVQCAGVFQRIGSAGTGTESVLTGVGAEHTVHHYRVCCGL